LSRAFAELDRRMTPIGELVLRRRLEPSLQVDVFEVKLGEEFLMSSLFTASEVALARLGLAAVDGDGLDVVVGGLGLGHTARAILEDQRVRSLRVVEALHEVIEWHERGLVPLGPEVTAVPRTELVHAVFFELVSAGDLGERGPQRFHALLVDIDHSPRHLLDGGHAGFYTSEGLAVVAGLLHPGGVFALWSDTAPDDEFSAVLDEVFASSRAEVVTFPNLLTGGTGASTVHVAVA
jgi:spermidine synthase